MFSKLPKPVQKSIKGRKVIVSEYTQIDYTGLSDVFVNVNSGVPLNAQELRNALHTPWAAYVRQMRKELAPLLIKMFGDKYKKRLIGDEWIVDTIDMVLNNYCKDKEISDYEINGVTQTSKNKLYVSNYADFDEKKITSQFSTLASYIDMMIDDKWEELSEDVILRKSSVTNLFKNQSRELLLYGILMQRVGVPLDMIE